MRAPITDKHLLEMMWERFPEIMQRGTEQADQAQPVAGMDAEGDVYRKEPPANWCPPHAPLYTSPPPRQPEQAQPEFFAQIEYDTPGWDVVASVYQRRKDQTPMLVHRENLPNQQPSLPPRQPLTEREIELMDGMIEVQLNHAARCDGIANRRMAEKQKAWDMERVELLRKLKAAHGIKEEI